MMGAGAPAGGSRDVSQDILGKPFPWCHPQDREPLKGREGKVDVGRDPGPFERHRLRPEPKEASEQTVIGILHGFGETTGLDTTVPGDGEPGDIDAPSALDSVDAVGPPAIGLEPKSSGTGIEAVHAQEPPRQFIADHQKTLGSGPCQNIRHLLDGEIAFHEAGRDQVMSAVVRAETRRLKRVVGRRLPVSAELWFGRHRSC